MNILQIANDFSGSTVYRNLFKELDNIEIQQNVYTAVRNLNSIGKNRIDFKFQESTIFYRNILSKYTRINFFAKIRRIVQDIESCVSLNEIDLIHAHTWYSDGGVALELAKKYNIPYIVTIRNTDLNLFHKYMFHLRSYGRKILDNAEKIIFISPSYLNRAKRSIFSKDQSENFVKSIVIPNGIDQFWQNNIEPRKNHVNETFQLIYMGKFSKGKNVLRLLKSVEKLNENGYRFHLHLIGGGGDQNIKILNYLERGKNFSFHGMITDQTKLKLLLMKSDAFVMPSKAETFGLVYIEALTQGIPVVYTENEGIDGFYVNKIGEAVNPNNIDSIANGIKKIYDNYDLYDFDPKIIAQNHNWQSIARRYESIYKTILQ